MLPALKASLLLDFWNQAASPLRRADLWGTYHLKRIQKVGYDWLGWEILPGFTVEGWLPGKTPDPVKPEGQSRGLQEPFLALACQRTPWQMQPLCSRGQVLLRVPLLSQPGVPEVSGQRYFHSQVPKRLFFTSPLILWELPERMAPRSLSTFQREEGIVCLKPSTDGKTGMCCLSFGIPGAQHSAGHNRQGQWRMSSTSCFSVEQ